MVHKSKKSEYTPQQYIGPSQLPREIPTQRYTYVAAHSDSSQNTTPRYMNNSLWLNETASSLAANDIPTRYSGFGPQPRNFASERTSIGNPTDQPAYPNIPDDWNRGPNPLSFRAHNVPSPVTGNHLPHGPSTWSARRYSATLPDSSTRNNGQSYGNVPAFQMMKREQHLVHHHLKTNFLENGLYHTAPQGITPPIGPYSNDAGPGNLGYVAFDPSKLGTFESWRASPRPVSCW